MGKILIIAAGIATLIVTESCETIKRLTTDVQTDSVRVSSSNDRSFTRTETIRKDTILIAGDSVVVEVPIFFGLPCPDTPVVNLTNQAITSKPFSGSASSSRVNLNYSFDGQNLRINCNADSLQYEIDSRDVEIMWMENRYDSLQSAKTKVVAVTDIRTVTQYRTPFWNWLAFIILIGIIFRRQVLAIAKFLISKFR